MSTRLNGGRGLTYSQQNFLEGFRTAGAVRDTVQPIIQTVTTPEIKEEKQEVPEVEVKPSVKLKTSPVIPLAVQAEPTGSNIVYQKEEKPLAEQESDTTTQDLII